MRRWPAGAVTAVGAALIAVVLVPGGPASASGDHADLHGKAHPTISAQLSSHARIQHDSALTAHVRVHGPRGVATGKVDIFDNSLECLGHVLVHGRARCSVAVDHSPANSHSSVEVIYHGDKRYRAEKIFAPLDITRTRPTLTLTTVPVSPVPAKSDLELIARIVDHGGYRAVGGSVRFSHNGTTYPDCQAQEPGLKGAVCSVNRARTGRYTMTAAFTGTKNFKPVRAAIVIKVGGPLHVATSSLPVGHTGLPYSVTLTGSGGTAPQSWTILRGGLPNGLTLKPSGLISGTPSATGTTTVTLEVTDALHKTAIKTFPLSIKKAGGRRTEASSPACDTKGTRRPRLARQQRHDHRCDRLDRVGVVTPARVAAGVTAAGFDCGRWRWSQV